MLIQVNGICGSAEGVQFLADSLGVEFVGGVRENPVDRITDRGGFDAPLRSKGIGCWQDEIPRSHRCNLAGIALAFGIDRDDKHRRPGE